MNDNVSALILCGGQSSRMGTDKGLKEKGGVPWAKQLYFRLSELGLRTYLSVRPEQEGAYRQRMPDISLISDQVLSGINGPLRGILSAHHNLADQHLLVVPCDMPRLSGEVFTLWLKTFHEQATTVISKAEQRTQPLCGIYHREGLVQLKELYQQQRLTDQSMYAIIENNLVTHSLEVPSTFSDQYKNFNTPQDER